MSVEINEEAKLSGSKTKLKDIEAAAKNGGVSAGTIVGWDENTPLPAGWEDTGETFGAQVLNEYSESTVNTYSADYINNHSGSASSDIIVIGNASEATDNTKILIDETDETLSNVGSEVVNSLNGNEEYLAPSVKVVNSALLNINNNITKNQTFSTEEQCIGTWIDGKPLYRKTFVNTLAASTVSGNFSIGVSGLDTAFIDSGNSYIIFGTTSIVQLGFYAGSTDWTRGYINGGKTKVYYNFGSAYNTSAKTFVVTIKYTKTGDIFSVGQNYAGRTLTLAFPTDMLYEIETVRYESEDSSSIEGEMPARFIRFGDSYLSVTLAGAAGTTYYTVEFYNANTQTTTTLYDASKSNSTGTITLRSKETSFTLPNDLANCSFIDDTATNITKYMS